MSNREDLEGEGGERGEDREDARGEDRARAWLVGEEAEPGDATGLGAGRAAAELAGAFVIVSLPLGAGQWQRTLTAAERDIAQWVLLGESNKRIAERRGTSVRTVANQIAGIYYKLGVTSRAELAARASRRDAEPC